MPNLSALADPPTHLVDGAAMDYFLIELVNTLRESSAVASARAKNVEKEMIDAGLIPPPAAAPPVPPVKENPRDSTTSLNSRGTTGKTSAVDEEEEGIRMRLEAIGLHVGANFTERYVRFTGVIRRITSKILPACRLCRDRPMFSETLDVIKFICKDIWASCWDKQVDNLRTNHRVCTLSATFV